MKAPLFPRPSLIVSASDNPDALNLVLESVGLQTRLLPEVEILIADQSTDDQIAIVVKKWSRALPGRVERFRSSGNSASSAPVLNCAARAATGDYLIFVDGDCLLERHFIADHLRNAKPATFVQGRRARVRTRYVRRVSLRSFRPMVWFLRRRIHGWRLGLRRPWPAVRLNDARAINGYNFALWREDFFRVNGFDETFDEGGDEVAELAERLWHAGLTLRTITGQAIVYHLDHHHRARYRTSVSEKILERTRREKLVRCEHGVTNIVPAAARSAPKALGVATLASS